MNVGIGTEAALFPEKECIIVISFAVLFSKHQQKAVVPLFYKPQAAAWYPTPLTLIKELYISIL